MTQLDALSSELQRRDPRFLRILSTNHAEGQGEYEVRSATTGRTLRQTFTFEGERIVTPLFDEATRLRLAAAAKAPDPYAAPLTAMRAAAATPLRKFEDAYKAARLAELRIEAEEVASEVALRGASDDGR